MPASEVMRFVLIDRTGHEVGREYADSDEAFRAAAEYRCGIMAVSYTVNETTCIAAPPDGWMSDGLPEVV